MRSWHILKKRMWDWRLHKIKGMAGKREERFHMSRPWRAPFDRTFCRAHVAASVQRDASSWMEIPALQPQLQHDTSDGRALPSAQPPSPGISPNHNGITSEKRPGESDFIIWRCGDICADRKKGARGPLAPLPCQPAFYYQTHTHAHTHHLKKSVQGSANQSKVKWHA